MFAAQRYHSMVGARGRLIVLLMILLVHQSYALNIQSKPLRPSLSRQIRAISTQLKMMDEHLYEPDFKDFSEMSQDEYYGRGQSRLSKLAQQSQQIQQAPVFNDDLHSTLNQELDLMEQKLLQFQEFSNRRSQELLDRLETFSRQEGFRRRDGMINAPAFRTTDGPFLGEFENDVENFNAYKGWDNSGMEKTVVPAAASVASLSSLGLLRDRMMKRKPKADEEWTQQDMKRNQHLQETQVRRNRSARTALSTAAGLGTFAAVSTNDLPWDRGLGTNPTVSALGAKRYNQNPFGSNRFSFNSCIANAATENFRGENDITSYSIETEEHGQIIQQPSESPFANTESSSFTIASEFSRESYGIYDSKPYAKEATYANVNSGFSAPLKESAPRKSRSFMFGGVSLRSLKSKIDSIVKEKSSETEQKVDKMQQLLRDKPAPIKNVEVEAPPKMVAKPDNTPLPIPSSPPQSTISETSVIPEKIPLSKDDISPLKPSAKVQTQTIPEFIQLSPDNVTPKQTPPSELKVITDREEPLKPPLIPSAPVVVPPKMSDMKATIAEKMETIKVPQLPGISRTPKSLISNDNAVHREPYSTEVAEFFDDLGSMIPTSEIQSPHGFYKGLGGGALTALIAKGFQGSTKRRRTTVASSEEVANALPRDGDLPQNIIETEQPYAFQSFSADTSFSKQSSFEIQTPSSYASSTTQANSGEARVSVSVESTLENGSSIHFSVSSSAEGATFSERSSANAPPYENAVNGSYLDSLCRASTITSTPGTGLQSYLGGLSNASPGISNTYNIGSSMDRFSSSLDSISRDLDSMSDVDMDFEAIDSVYKDLNSVSDDISSVSKTLVDHQIYNDINGNPMSSASQFGSYLDSISDDTSTICGGQGITSYLDDLRNSHGASTICSGKGPTSYLDSLASASALMFDVVKQTDHDSIQLTSFDVPSATSSSFEEYTDSTTSCRSSYLDYISDKSAISMSGQGLTSYLSDLSSAAPLTFDIAERDRYSSVDIVAAEQGLSDSSDNVADPSLSFSNPASDITTQNTARPRRVRVFVDASVNVSRR